MREGPKEMKRRKNVRQLEKRRGRTTMVAGRRSPAAFGWPEMVAGSGGGGGRSGGGWRLERNER